MNHQLTSLKPSNLGIAGVSYDNLLKGVINTDVRMPLHQQGILKAFQEICVKDGRDTFISVAPNKLITRLKKTSIAPFIPEGSIDPDIQVMISRGWLKKDNGDQVALTDYAKEVLLKVKVSSN